MVRVIVRYFYKWTRRCVFVTVTSFYFVNKSCLFCEKKFIVWIFARLMIGKISASDIIRTLHELGLEQQNNRFQISWHTVELAVSSIMIVKHMTPHYSCNNWSISLCRVFSLCFVCLLLDLLRNECSHIQHIRCTNILTSYILKTHTDDKNHTDDKINQTPKIELSAQNKSIHNLS